MSILTTISSTIDGLKSEGNVIDKTTSTATNVSSSVSSALDSSTVNKVASKVGAGTLITNLQKALTKSKEKIADGSTKINEIRNNILKGKTTATSTLNAVKTIIDVKNLNLESLQTSLTTVGSLNSTLGSKVTDINSKITDINSKITSTKEKVSEYKEKYEKYKQKVEDAKSKVSEYKDKASSVLSKLGLGSSKDSSVDYSSMTDAEAIVYDSNGLKHFINGFLSLLTSEKIKYKKLGGRRWAVDASNNIVEGNAFLMKSETKTYKIKDSDGKYYWLTDYNSRHLYGEAIDISADVLADLLSSICSKEDILEYMHKYGICIQMETSESGASKGTHFHCSTDSNPQTAWWGTVNKYRNENNLSLYSIIASSSYYEDEKKNNVIMA